MLQLTCHYRIADRFAYDMTSRHMTLSYSFTHELTEINLHRFFNNRICNPSLLSMPLFRQILKTVKLILSLKV